jgi:RNA polymerase sigma factor for flagellar operon FliA
MRGEELVYEHREMVRGLAYQLRRELQLAGELDDLVAYGFGGLLEAGRRFDPSRGVRFKTFAYHRVRGAMLDGIRKMSAVPRRAHERLRAQEAPEPTAAPTPLDKAFARIRAGLTTASPLPWPRREPDPELAALRNESLQRLLAALALLPSRERYVVRGHYFEGRSLEELARELGCSRSWASRLHTRALRALRTTLDESAGAPADRPKSPCSR